MAPSAPHTQGAAHAVTREEPTLVALERETPDDKLRFEYAHVSYFPNLVLHGMHDALFPPKAKPKAC